MLPLLVAIAGGFVWTMLEDWPASARSLAVLTVGVMVVGVSLG